MKLCTVETAPNDWNLLFQGVLIGASVLPGLRGSKKESAEDYEEKREFLVGNQHSLGWSGTIHRQHQ
jgi:hypothetical protein